MYWTLSTRPPTLEEIIFQGNARIRAAVEAVCARYDAPQIDAPSAASAQGGMSLEDARKRLKEMVVDRDALLGKGASPMEQLAENYGNALASERMKVLMPGRYIERDEAQIVARMHHEALARMHHEAFGSHPRQNMNGYMHSPFYSRGPYSAQCQQGASTSEGFGSLPNHAASLFFG